MRKMPFLIAGFVSFGLAASIQAQTTTGGTGTGTGTGTGSSSGNLSSTPGTGGTAGFSGTAPGTSFAGQSGTGFFSGAAPGVFAVQPGSVGQPPKTSGQGAITASNVFRTWYANPMAVGLTTNTTQPAFGQPLYTITVATTGGLGGAAGLIPGGLGGALGAASTTGGTGFSTVGIRRAPVYMTTLGYGAPMVTYQGGQVLGNVQQILGQTSGLTSRQNLAVALEEGTFVLRGQVPSERERRLAEGVVRLTPGVRSVRNEIVVTK